MEDTFAQWGGYYSLSDVIEGCGSYYQSAMVHKNHRTEVTNLYGRRIAIVVTILSDDDDRLV